MKILSCLKNNWAPCTLIACCCFSGAASGNPVGGVAVPGSATFGATVSLSNLSYTYDGTPKAATCDTVPSGLATSITYSDAGSGTGLIHAGQYAVACTITAAGYSGSAIGVLVISPRALTGVTAPNNKYGYVNTGTATATGNGAGTLTVVTSSTPAGALTITAGSNYIGNIAGNYGVQSGGSLVVSGSIAVQSTNANLIDWSNFRISPGESTNFVQPANATTALNRVTGIDPSMVLGQLQSNGKVFLVDQAGHLFDASAIATVDGLIPATATVASAGWNLLGNCTDAPLDVAAAFSDASKVASVWKWNPATSSWAFYSPSLLGQALADYAASKGLDVLTGIGSGQGFWVNARIPFAFALPTGNLLSAAALKTTLASGWNMASMGENMLPSQFNSASTQTPPTQGMTPDSLTTLWAWDNTQSNWYFYAPSLEAKGATALTDYVRAKGLLDFATMGKKLSPGTGFWMNHL